MATAAELLAGMSTGDDTTLVIDNYLRTIHIPKKITNLGVEHDDEVLTLNFKMPRYLDDIDLSTFAIHINYINANGDSDVYTVNDSKKIVTTDNILFSWLVGPTATAYKGDTKFIVCMKTIHDNGYIDKEYNTTIASLPVLEGLEVDPGVLLRYSDIIEQWRQELFGIEESAVQAITDARDNAKNTIITETKNAIGEVITSIPKEYQETAEAAQEGIRTKADAIVNTAEGNTISVSDSSDDHLRGLRIFGKTSQVTTTGKNLARNELYTMKTNGLTIIVHSDKTFTVNGTATAGTFLTIHTDFNPGAGEYILSGCPSTGGVSRYILYMTDAESGFYTQDVGNGYTFTHPGDIAPDLRLAIYEGVTVNNALFKPMIRLATVEDDTYEPYSGGVASPDPSYPQNLMNAGSDNDSIETEVYGKNLFDQNGTVTSTSSGFVLNATLDHGAVSVSGTSMLGYGTLKTLLPLGVFKKGETYRISRVTKNFHAGFWFYDENDYNLGTLTTENSASYTVPENADHMSLFYAGLTPETEVNLTEKFMLNLGTEALPWEPSVESQSIISTCPNGLPGLKVTSAELATYTDSDGQHWVCDEIDYENQKKITRIAKVTLDGTQRYGINSYQLGSTGKYLFEYYPGNISQAALDLPALSDKLVLDKWGNFGPDEDKAKLYATSGRLIMFFPDQSIQTTEAFAEYLIDNPIQLMYELTEPIETDLTAEEIEAFKALRSNYSNTTVLNDSGARMELTYNADTKTYVENGIQRTVSEVMEAIANGSY